MGGLTKNQTCRHEVRGGYLGSPKRNAHGAPYPFYESMREVAPGDLILDPSWTPPSWLSGLLYLVAGKARGRRDSAGRNRGNIGWKVRVSFKEHRPCGRSRHF